MSILKPGSTSVTRYIILVDSAAGTPETGYTIADLDLQYTRNRTDPAAKVDAMALPATDSVWDDNKAIEVDATSSPGLYRVDWPNAAFAAGVDKVQLVVSGSGLHPAVEEIQLVEVPADVTKWLGTAAATPTVAGVPEVDLTHLMGTILTETSAGYLAAAFIKLFDVVTPLLVTSDVMVGTDGANVVVPDVAGTAAGLHAATDALIAALVVPDAAGTAAALHAATDALINALTVPDAAGTAAALHAISDALIGVPIALDGAAATIAAMLTKLADDAAGANFDAETDSQRAIATRVINTTPAAEYPDDARMVAGANEVGDHTKLSTDDEDWWSATDPDAANPLEMCVYVDGAANTYPVSISINGRYNALPGRRVHVFAANLDHASAISDTAGTATDAIPSVLTHSVAGSFTGLTLTGYEIYITSGTNAIPGFYTIASHTDDALTLDRNCSSGGDVTVIDFSVMVWNQLSNDDTAIKHKVGDDADYSYPLGTANMTTDNNEIFLRFSDESQISFNVGYTLRLDRIAVLTQSIVGGGVDPIVLAEAVHNELDAHLQHIPTFAGTIYIVNGDIGDDSYSGKNPTAPFATIAKAISVVSEGDLIRVKAGTYAEDGLNLNVAGVELFGEIGAIIAPTVGTALEVSASNCLVEGMWIEPVAGEVGLDVTGAINLVHLQDVHCYGGGAISFRTAVGANHIHMRECVARGYSATGLQLQGPSAIVTNFRAMADAVGATRGFYISNAAADRCIILNSHSLNNATKSFEIVAGANECEIINCTESTTCGGITDAGTNTTWRNFKDDIADVALATHDTDIKERIAAYSQGYPGDRIFFVDGDNGSPAPAGGGHEVEDAYDCLCNAAHNGGLLQNGGVLDNLVLPTDALIAGAHTPTQVQLTAGSPVNDTYNGMLCNIIHAGVTYSATVTAYTGATRIVEFLDIGFIPADSDNVYILEPNEPCIIFVLGRKDSNCVLADGRSNRVNAAYLGGSFRESNVKLVGLNWPKIYYEAGASPLCAITLGVGSYYKPANWEITGFVFEGVHAGIHVMADYTSIHDNIFLTVFEDYAAFYPGVTGEPASAVDFDYGVVGGRAHNNVCLNNYDGVYGIAGLLSEWAPRWFSCGSQAGLFENCVKTRHCGIYKNRVEMPSAMVIFAKYAEDCWSEFNSSHGGQIPASIDHTIEFHAVGADKPIRCHSNNDTKDGGEPDHDASDGTDCSVEGIWEEAYIKGVVNYDTVNFRVEVSAGLYKRDGVVDAGATWTARICDYDGTVLIGEAGDGGSVGDWSNSGQVAGDYVAYWDFTDIAAIVEFAQGKSYYVRIACEYAGNTYTEDIYAGAQ